jgi:methyl-accepting chemotaxis protein
VLDTATALSRQSDELAGEVADFLTAIKTAGDRRKYERKRASGPVTIIAEGHEMTGKLIDISLGGACTDPAVSLPAGTAVRFEAPGWPSVKARIVGREDGHCHLQFALDRETQWQLQQSMEKLVA